MSVLQERWLHPSQTSHQAMREAGGLWVAMGRPDPDELVAEARQRGVRALEVQQNDLAVLAELPELEFLYVASDPTDVSPLSRLPNLRLLAFTGTWDDELDFSAFPHLEWFDAVECPRGGGGLSSLFVGHERLHTLGIGRYPWPDLAPLGALRLRRLVIWNSRKLSALDGADALAGSLRDLSLSSLPNLTSLAGLGLLPGLEVLSLESLRHVTTLTGSPMEPRLPRVPVSLPSRVRSSDRSRVPRAGGRVAPPRAGSPR